MKRYLHPPINVLPATTSFRYVAGFHFALKLFTISKPLKPCFFTP
jgi:hypothetical protein